MAALGKNLIMQAADQIGILQNDREGYATPESVGAVLAQYTVSPMAGNQLSVGVDGLLYISSLSGSPITKVNYTLTYTGPGGTIAWDDGAISTDAGNIIVRGSDDGLFAPSDAIASNPLAPFEITHTACDGSPFTWHDGRISTDAGNALTRGSDDGLYISTAAAGNIVKVGYTLTYTNGSIIVSWDDGSVSTDPGNEIIRGLDGGLFAPSSLLSLQPNGYTLVYQHGSDPPVIFDHGNISADAGNALVRGTDDGLMIPSDALTVAPDTYTLTHTSNIGLPVTFEDGRVSADPGNSLIRGTDGGLFVGAGAGPGGTILKIWIDTVGGDNTNDGLSPATPIQGLSALGGIVTANSGAVYVEVTIRGAIPSSWSLSTYFLPHQHVVFKSWDNDPLQTLVTPDNGALDVSGVAFFEGYGISVGVLDASPATVRLHDGFRGRISAREGARVDGRLTDWDIPQTTLSYHAVEADASAVVVISADTLDADVGDPTLVAVNGFVASNGSYVGLFISTINATMHADNSGFIVSRSGGNMNLSCDTITLIGAGSTIEFIASTSETIVSANTSIALDLTNGAPNRIMQVAGGRVMLTTPLLDAAIASDGTGMFRLSSMGFAQVSAGIVTNSASTATGDTVSCIEGSDLRIWGADSSLNILDKNLLVAALNAAGPGAAGASATIRIGDTYYTPTTTAVY